MRGNVLGKFLAALMAAAAVIILAHYATNDFKTEMKTQKAEQKKDTKKKKIPVFKASVDWENLTTTIYWRPSEKDTKYHIAYYTADYDEEDFVGEEDIPVSRKPSFTHQIIYGTTYEYEIRIYRMINGKECWASTKSYQVNVSVPDLWTEEEPWSITGVCLEKTTDSTDLYFDKYGYSQTPPKGIEIYRGEKQDHLELVDTVLWDDLPDADSEDWNWCKVYTDKRNSYADYYQVRSFTDVAGMRKYGKRSETRLFLAKDYQGEAAAKINVTQTEQINQIEVVMTNKSKLPFRMGKKYLRSYLESTTEKQPLFWLYHYGGYDALDRSSAELGIDEIAYKFQASDEYQILSGKDTVSIKPQETIYLRFARSDGKEFENRFYRREDTSMNIYLFRYMGKNVFLDINNDYNSDINNDVPKVSIGWGEPDEPYYEGYE